ncbi:M20/M25/M40 family metallo-hydrolase [Candidatus Woesearchaeota archaeon]|jgi:succinyl-diaminopimelate desuccinylase|nr:M20/M25/M40 family metallo-hydrolase [Candidatus Woesearchaeota archaeon]
MDEIIKILKELVEHDSSTKDGANSLLELVIEKYLQPAGYALKNFSFNGHNSVYASVNENYTPRILFLGHLDTVDAKGWELHDPFKLAIENELAYGLGVLDMKAGVAAMLHLATTKVNPNIAYLFVTDEEIGGFNGAGKIVHLEDPLIKPDFVIAAEPSEMQIGISAKGFLNVEVAYKGKSAHSSKPEEGINAIEQLSSYIQAVRSNSIFEKSNDLLGKTTFSQTLIKCLNERENQVPDYCETVVNLRYIPELTREQILSVFNKTAKENYIEGGEIIVKEFGRAPHGFSVGCSTENVEVKKLAEIITNETGNVLYRGGQGASDARFFAEKKIPVICFGPSGNGMHAPEENLNLDSFQKYITILEKYVEEIK